MSLHGIQDKIAPLLKLLHRKLSPGCSTFQTPPSLRFACATSSINKGGFSCHAVNKGLNRGELSPLFLNIYLKHKTIVLLMIRGQCEATALRCFQRALSALVVCVSELPPTRCHKPCDDGTFRYPKESPKKPCHEVTEE